MGCDIHCFAEKRNKETNKWEMVHDYFPLDEFDKKYYNKDKGSQPFSWRSYSLFAFLADVRNYDHCEPISKPKGLPADVSSDVLDQYEQWEQDAHSQSYLTVAELLDFDYDKSFWNRRVTKQDGNGWSGAALAEEGEGKIVSYRENLGEMFFERLSDLESLGDPNDVRIVFWFDN